MAEKLSETADYQRFDEMFIHLTPVGARVPYSVCLDDDSNVWIASKGGIFKFDETGTSLLWLEKNPFPKKVSPYCHILNHQGKMISVFGDEESKISDFKIMKMSGEVISQQLVDGNIQSISLSEAGDMFITKKIRSGSSAIFSCHIDCLIGMEELICSDEFAFQCLCVMSPTLLLVATCTLPVNMYSKQSLRLIDLEKRQIILSFSEKGKDDGMIFSPIAMQKYGEDVLILDKTGRIQQFTVDGSFIRVAAKIDAYLGNGFIVHSNQALLVCSGIVLDKDNNTICDDWLEKVNLDGSRWIPNPGPKLR